MSMSGRAFSAMTFAIVFAQYNFGSSLAIRHIGDDPRINWIMYKLRSSIFFPVLYNKSYEPNDIICYVTWLVNVVLVCRQWTEIIRPFVFCSLTFLHDFNIDMIRMARRHSICVVHDKLFYSIMLSKISIFEKKIILLLYDNNNANMRIIKTRNSTKSANLNKLLFAI